MTASLISFLSGCIAFSPATPDTARYHITARWDVEAEQVYADALGQVYAIRGEEITRWDPGMEIPAYTFSRKSSGKPSGLDVSNPLKPLVFFEDYMQVQYLDRQLAAQGEPLQLDRLGYPQAREVCASHNNGLWLYDPESLSLIRLDRDGKKTHESGNLDPVTGRIPQPVSILQSGNYVYLADKGSGVMVFDIYGAFRKVIPVPDLEKSTVHDGILWVLTAGRIQRMDLEKSQWLPLVMPEIPVSDFAVSGKKLWVVSSGRIVVLEK